MNRNARGPLLNGPQVRNINQLYVGGLPDPYVPESMGSWDLGVVGESGLVGLKRSMPVFGSRKFAYMIPLGSGNMTVHGEAWSESVAGTNVAADGTDGVTRNYATTNVALNVNGVFTNQSNWRTDRNLYMQANIKVVDTTFLRAIVGFSSSAPSSGAVTSDNGAGHMAVFQFSTNSADTFWYIHTRDNTTTSRVQTGVPFAAAMTRFEVIQDRARSRWLFFINGVFQGFKYSNIPGDAITVQPVFAICTLETVIKNIRVQSLYIEEDK